MPERIKSWKSMYNTGYYSFVLGCQITNQLKTGTGVLSLVNQPFWGYKKDGGRLMPRIIRVNCELLSSYPG